MITNTTEIIFNIYVVKANDSNTQGMKIGRTLIIICNFSWFQMLRTI